jgi:hypothetical protein
MTEGKKRGNINHRVATLSNCGDTLKLHLPNDNNIIVAMGKKDHGYGKNGEDVTMGNPQPSPKLKIFSKSNPNF